MSDFDLGCYALQDLIDAIEGYDFETDPQYMTNIADKLQNAADETRKVRNNLTKDGLLIEEVLIEEEARLAKWAKEAYLTADELRGGAEAPYEPLTGKQLGVV